MNKHEVHGGARYIGGKIEKTIGDAVDSRDWQVDGVVDQVAGGAEHLFGRGQSIAKDAFDAAPGIAAEARERIEDTVEDAVQHAGQAVRRGVDRARDTDATQRGVAIGLGGAIVGYAFARLIHGRSA